MITDFWCAANKGGSLMIFTEKPKRNSKLGVWEGNVYINSWVYDTILDMLVQSGFSWSNEPQFLQIQNRQYTSKSTMNLTEDAKNKEESFTDEERQLLNETMGTKTDYDNNNNNNNNNA